MRKGFKVLILSILVALIVMSASGCDIIFGKNPDQEPSGEQPKAQLSAPTVILDDHVVTWQAVENADRYDVYLNGNLVRISDENSFEVPENERKNYTVYVVASRADGSFLDSEPGNTVHFEFSIASLEAPVIRQEGSKILWEPVEGAEFYDILVDGVTVTVVPATFATEWNIYMPENGEYKVEVKACMLGNNPLPPSPASNALTVTLDNKMLAKPVVTVDGCSLVWQEVVGATDYDVFVDGVRQQRIDIVKENGECRWVMTNIDAGSYTYEVQAISSNEEYSERSEKSTAISNNISGAFAWTPEQLLLDWTISGDILMHDQGICLETGVRQASMSKELTVNVDNAYLYISFRKFARAVEQDKDPKVQVLVGDKVITAYGEENDYAKAFGDDFELYIYDLSEYAGQTITISIVNIEGEHACFDKVGIVTAGANN